MKRILFVILTFVATHAAAQTVSVGNASGQCGSAVTVPVSIDSASGLLAVEFRIAYDAARLTPTNVTSGTLTSGFSLANNAAAGVLTVAMASGSPVNGAGTIANVSFNIAAAANGTVPLAITNVLVNDVPRTGTAGSVSITCLQPPAAPALTAPANGATSVTLPITLRWNAASDATSYRVSLGTSNPPPAILNTSDTSYTPNLQSGTTYYWMIESINTAGMTASPLSTFTTAAVVCATPAAPQLSGPAQITSGSNVDLTWNAVTSATEFVVEESASASFSSAAQTATSATTLSLSRSSTAEITLYFRVRGRNTSSGCNSDGASSNSVTVRIVPRAALAASTKIFPVAGTIDGTLGSLFRTSLQLHNPTAATITGRVVFHTGTGAGADSDPSLAYSLAPSELISYSDLLTSIGVARALGSADVIPTAGHAAPISIVRIFNDAGNAGTTGMTLDALDPRDAIQSGQRAALLAPSDPNRLRMNIGIRTLLDGATILVTVRDKRGATINSSRWTYPATHFEQASVMQFANAVLLGDETVTIAVESGSAFVYGTVTDNVTNDPSIQIARSAP